MSRLRTALLFGGIVAALGVASTATLGLGGTEPTTKHTSGPALATAQITEQTMVSAITLNGELGFGSATSLEIKATGTITWLPATGSVVSRGGALAKIDEKPVQLLYGSVPMYRQLAENTKGPDVRQLEANLQSLGYRGITVDETFSSATTTAVKRWQKDLGVTETGTVEAGSVAFLAGPIRISRLLVKPGAAAPVAAMEYTSTVKVITVQTDPQNATWAAKGRKVTVKLPDGSETPGTVDAVGSEGSTADSSGEGAGSAGSAGDAGGQSASEVEIIIALTDQAAVQALDRGQVRVRHVVEERAGVLTVPVPALLALAEGGYGIELVEGGSTRLVAVRTGMFADGRVEISGEGLRAGMIVRVPE